MTTRSLCTTSRQPYESLTPEVSNFDIPLDSPHATTKPTFEPAPRRPDLDRNYAKASSRWRRMLKRAKATIDNNTGMLLIAASQAFFSLMNVAVKTLNSLDEPVHAFELIWVRMSITWICCVAYMYYAQIPDPFLGPKGVRLLLMLRGFFGFFGLFGIYYSLQYLSLSDATVLTFLSPLLTAAVGAIVLKEDFSKREALAGLFSLAGVVLIARPAFLFGRAARDVIPDPGAAVGDALGTGIEPAGSVTSAERLVAVGVALLGVCGSTGAYTSIRAVGKRAHPLHNIVFFSSQCVLVATIAMIVLRIPIIIPTRPDWLAMLLMIGLFGFIAQVLLTMGLQRETAGRGSMAIYLQIIFATIFERIFFHTSPTFLSILGTLVIMASAIYVAVLKNTTSGNRITDITVDAALEEGLLENQEDIAEGPKDVEDGARASYELPVISKI